jgi:bis(5'-nucleosyl)-tetraphosphatase (symmetrical)
MATWVIGDVQGCMGALEELLGAIGWKRGRDRVLLAGDLVNRGPRSLDVLRWARAQGEGVSAVLGNHDVHLLGRAAGLVAAKKRDTLDELLAAPDRDALIAWLAACPLLHEEGGHVLVHAGVAPGWTLSELRARARAAETLLGGPERDRLLVRSDDWSGPLGRARETLAALTRLRVARPDGRMLLDFDGPPSAAPPGAQPWWDLCDASLPTMVCGHWARAGLVLRPRLIALDTGCVWGGALTAVRLGDRRVVQVPCRA